jgi:D-alanyl-D-alanine carboxypeptidase
VNGLAAVQARIAAIENRFTSTVPPVRAAAPTRSLLGFDDLLGAQLGAAATPARQLAPGQYGAVQPPAALAAYGNGRVPADALTPIGTGDHRLHAPAARAFEQLSAAARADGVTIGITDSYRSYEAQVRLAEEKGLYSQGGLAAEPGTSNHVWGLAADLDLDDGAQAWMRTNAWRYGFVEDTPREPWHWTYRPAN